MQRCDTGVGLSPLENTPKRVASNNGTAMLPPASCKKQWLRHEGAAKEMDRLKASGRGGSGFKTAIFLPGRIASWFGFPHANLLVVSKKQASTEMAFGPLTEFRWQLA